MDIVPPIANWLKLCTKLEESLLYKHCVSSWEYLNKAHKKVQCTYFTLIKYSRGCPRYPAIDHVLRYVGGASFT